jgi:hypothetical protein
MEVMATRSRCCALVQPAAEAVAVADDALDGFRPGERDALDALIDLALGGLRAAGGCHDVDQALDHGSNLPLLSVKGMPQV